MPQQISKVIRSWRKWSIWAVAVILLLRPYVAPAADPLVEQCQRFLLTQHQLAAAVPPTWLRYAAPGDERQFSFLRVVVDPVTLAYATKLKGDFNDPGYLVQQKMSFKILDRPAVLIIQGDAAFAGMKFLLKDFALTVKTLRTLRWQRKLAQHGSLILAVIAGLVTWRHYPNWDVILPNVAILALGGALSDFNYNFLSSGYHELREELSQILRSSLYSLQNVKPAEILDGILLLQNQDQLAVVEEYLTNLRLKLIPALPDSLAQELQRDLAFSCQRMQEWQAHHQRGQYKTEGRGP